MLLHLLPRVGGGGGGVPMGWDCGWGWDQDGLSFLLAATFTHVFARSAKDDDDGDGLT